MFRMSKRLFYSGLICLVSIALIGCDKEVNLTFFNGTHESRDLVLFGPGEGTGYLGSVGAMSKVKTKIKVDEGFLPATYSWEAGQTEGEFTITKESPGKLMIAIERGGSVGPIDEKTEVQKDEHLEAKDVIVEQETVVE